MGLGAHDDDGRALEQKIESAVERLVREHLTECESAATKAVRAGFLRAARSSAKAASPKSKTGRSASRRRSREELAALEERLFAAICAHPGETMSVIAPPVGTTARELRRPSTLLRRSVPVRSVGQRHGMRDFPFGE